MEEAAIANTARAIQFIDNPPEDLLLHAVQSGWNNLAYVENPSPALIQAALSQSGWAIRYIPNPSEELQLQAVRKNYDAVKYIKNPSAAVQEAAVAENYEALRYIDAPAPSAVFAAVQKAEQAVLLLSHPTKEQMLSFFALNPMVMKYVPKDCIISRDELKEVLRRVLSQDDVSEPYVRAFINCSALDMSPVDKVLFVDQWGSAKAKKITVDEKLTIK